jgi:hypothetical protein
MIDTSSQQIKEQKMSIPFVVTAATVALVTLPPMAVSTYALTAGRFWSLVAGLVAVVGVVLGGVALARSAGRVGGTAGQRLSITGLGAGLTGAVIGGLVVGAADGGPGTGYGIVGGFMALAIGLVAMGVSGLALIRARRFQQVAG